MERNCSPTESENITSFALFLTATDRSEAFSGAGAEQPIWPHIEMRIERAFKYGGRVELRTQEKNLIGSGVTKTPWWAYTVAVAMESKIGMFRLVVTTQHFDEKFPIREWWEIGDTPFRGNILFGDDEWDTRMVCTDVLIAKQIFKDFFDHGELNEASFSQMRSYYDPKS